MLRGSLCSKAEWHEKQGSPGLSSPDPVMGRRQSGFLDTSASERQSESGSGLLEQKVSARISMESEL